MASWAIMTTSATKTAIGTHIAVGIRLFYGVVKFFRWTYTDPKRRIVAKRITGTVH